jgi:molybdopterin-guanine dinucleotide biosynthesis protein A
MPLILGWQDREGRTVRSGKGDGVIGRNAEPVGIVLAGGLGRRIGGAKACVELLRRPLISYPLEAVRRALGNVTIVAKGDTELPSLRRVAVWIEPQEPRHPLTGMVHALAMSEGRPVLVCAADMPLVTPELIAAIARADPGDAPAVVASIGGESQPLLGCYQPGALEPLIAASAGSGASGGVPLRDAVAALGPWLYEVADPDELFNVNSPSDLLQASAMLDRRRAGARHPAARP